MAEQLGNFQQQVLKELKEATKHFSFKAYEQSFQKLEESHKENFAKLVTLRDDFEFESQEHKAWKDAMQENLRKHVT